MHPMVYLMLLAAPCLARYRFEPRDLVERDEPQQRGEWVDCPVCEFPSFSSQFNSESCNMREGRSMKLCRFGTYINDFCGSRRDCYRGPDEKCTPADHDEYGKQCAPGYTCSSATGKCMGLGRSYRIGELHNLNNERYLLNARRAHDIEIGHM